MLYWALMFLVVALVAAIFGFGGIASTATGIHHVSRQMNQSSRASSRSIVGGIWTSSTPLLS